MNTERAETGGTNRAREQKLVIYHPNNAGTGAAVQLEPRFNRRESDRYNCFFLEMAAQKTAPGREEGHRVPATFDWERKLTVKLDFNDICEILAVLEGRAEKVGGARSGLFHDSGQASTVITFQRNTEKGGYLLGLSRKEKADAQAQAARVHMVLSEAEAIGLRCIFQHSLFYLTFHTHLFGWMADVGPKAPN